MTEKLLFPSDEWIEKYIEALNNNPRYEDAAKTWEGDFIFPIDEFLKAITNRIKTIV